LFDQPRHTLPQLEKLKENIHSRNIKEREGGIKNNHKTINQTADAILNLEIKMNK
jgi:hypothetical protein